jgi:hypothetical protein
MGSDFIKLGCYIKMGRNVRHACEMTIFEEKMFAQVLTSFTSNKSRNGMNNTICKNGAVWHSFAIVQQVYITFTETLKKVGT